MPGDLDAVNGSTCLSLPAKTRNARVCKFVSDANLGKIDLVGDTARDEEKVSGLLAAGKAKVEQDAKLREKQGQARRDVEHVHAHADAPAVQSRRRCVKSRGGPSLRDRAVIHMSIGSEKGS